MVEPTWVPKRSFWSKDGHGQFAAWPLPMPSWIAPNSFRWGLETCFYILYIYNLKPRAQPKFQPSLPEWPLHLNGRRHLTRSRSGPAWLSIQPVDILKWTTLFSHVLFDTIRSFSCQYVTLLPPENTKMVDTNRGPPFSQCGNGWVVHGIICPSKPHVPHVFTYIYIYLSIYSLIYIYIYIYLYSLSRYSRCDFEFQFEKKTKLFQFGVSGWSFFAGLGFLRNRASHAWK